MIKPQDAVAAARALLGTPYSEMDCIRLIVMIIRRCPGGEAQYRCEGTNWLWRSMDNSSRYRHLTWRQEGVSGAQAGMLAFKRSGGDVHHVGLVTGEGTVIHSSSAYGRVVETPLDGSWQLLARHREIAAAAAQDAPGAPAAGCTGDDALSAPVTSLMREEDGACIQIYGRWRVAQD